MNMHSGHSILTALVTVACTIPFVQADAPVTETGFISVSASKIAWTDAPSVAPGAKLSVIEGDLKKAEPFTFRLKLPENSKIDVHTHPTHERVTLVSGGFYFAIGDKYDEARAQWYGPGDIFIVPPDVPMYGFTKSSEVVLQIHGTGPWGIHFHEEGGAH